MTAEVLPEILQQAACSRCTQATQGTNASEVRQRLEAIFRWRAAAWDAVLRLDEADVFVLARDPTWGRSDRGRSSCAPWSTYSGLQFMTTNAPMRLMRLS